MNYTRQDMIDLLTPAVIEALKNIYGFGLRDLAVRLGCSKQAVFYLLKNDRLKDYQKEILLQYFQDYAQIEYTELLLLHTMTSKKKVKE